MRLRLFLLALRHFLAPFDSPFLETGPVDLTLDPRDFAGLRTELVLLCRFGDRVQGWGVFQDLLELSMGIGLRHPLRGSLRRGRDGGRFGRGDSVGSSIVPAWPPDGGVPVSQGTALPVAGLMGAGEVSCRDLGPERPGRRAPEGSGTQGVTNLLESKQDQLVIVRLIPVCTTNGSGSRSASVCARAMNGLIRSDASLYVAQSSSRSIHGMSVVGPSSVI